MIAGDPKDREKELCIPSIGSTLHDGRYKIVGPHLSTIQTPYHYDYATLVALDTKELRYVCLQILGATASKSITYDRIETIVKATGPEAARDCLLVPLAAFIHEEHMCVVTELMGPDLHRLRAFDGPEYALFPPRWLRQVAHDALQGLRLLHTHGFTHGAIGPMDLVICYPQVDATSKDQVQAVFKAFPAEGEKPSLVSFNETGTAMLEQPDSDRFRLKLQNFTKSFHIDGKPSPVAASEYQSFPLPPPPELESKGSVGAWTDMWYLGMILAQLFSAMPEFGDLEDLLPNGVGELASASGPGKLRAAMTEQRRDAEERAVASGEKVKPFTPHGLELAVDLVAGLLRYEQDERLTADQALQHDFFKSGEVQQES